VWEIRQITPPFIKDDCQFARQDHLLFKYFDLTAAADVADCLATLRDIGE
jgi:hypothetical protein